MRRVREKLSFSNVVAVLALFVALGGSAYAATQLPKNSVGAKQLKANAVTGAKVKNGSLTGADISVQTLGTVPSAANAANAAHAASADTATHAASAGTATNATHAVSADTATAATSAASANVVGGVEVKGFSYQTPSNGGTATLFSMDGLTLTATCSAGRVDARTSTDHAYISSEWVAGSGTAARATDTDFNTGDTFPANTTTGAETGSIEYVQAGGKRVSVSLQVDMATACTVSGHAFASG